MFKRFALLSILIGLIVILWKGVSIWGAALLFVGSISIIALSFKR